MSKPRQLTNEEVRDRFMALVWSYIDYWEHDARVPDVHGKLQGMAFGIMNILDGTSEGSPSFCVAPMPHPEDEKFHRDRGDNWFPDVKKLGTEADISCGNMLHDYFYEYARKMGRKL